LENLFLALADGTRLRLLKICSKILRVFDFAELLNRGFEKISRHLAFCGE